MPLHRLVLWSLATGTCLAPWLQAHAANAVVTNSNDSGAGSLRQAITDANSGGGTITFSGALSGQTIVLSSGLPQISANVTIEGSGAPGVAISGNNASRIFFVQSGTVAISNVILKDGLARGGSGNLNPQNEGGGGGGGMGAGGAIFVNGTANVTLTNVTLSDNSAAGGKGGDSVGGFGLYDAGGGGGGLNGDGGRGGFEGGGGGGGFDGDGGSGPNATNNFAGAEGGGKTSNGFNAVGNSPGGGGSPEGGDGGSSGNDGGAGAANGGGGGGGSSANGGAGGDFGGGGGGGYGGTLGGGDGGFGGGGGGGGGGGTNAGGAGGFGGGDGGRRLQGGNGGSGYGGAIFVRQGGTLTIVNSDSSGGSVTGGAVGSGGASSAGDAAGAGLFLHGATTASFNTGTASTIANDIAGTGGLAKTGAGVLTLSGANSYGGGTTINDGTVSIASDGNLGASSGSLAFDGGTLRNTSTVTSNRLVALNAGGGTFQTNADLSLGGVVGGLGALKKTGTGTLTLSGANSYGGGTDLIAGTLQVANNSALGTGTLFLKGGTLQAGGAYTIGNDVRLDDDATIDANGTSFRIDGDIAGSSGVTFTDTTGTFGEVALGGDNRYSGATTIGGQVIVSAASTTGLSANSDFVVNGGSLQLNGYDNTIKSLSGTGIVSNDSIARDATLTIAPASGTTTFSGMISDGSRKLSLVKAGAGTQILSGFNSYTGGTTVTGGTLKLSGFGALGAASGSTTVAGGTLDLGGTLQFLSGDVILKAGAINNGDLSTTGLFDLRQGTIIASLGGNGNLVKSGSGTVTLSGFNFFTGDMKVLDGKLIVDGSIIGASGLLVGPGGTLGGSGFLPAATIDGTLSPGNSIGTLTVAGDLVFGAGSKYAVEISSANSDRTDVIGTATLTGGSVIVTAQPDTYVQREYLILTADGGLGGTEFKGIAGAPKGFASTLVYDDGNVYLDLDLLLNQPEPPTGPRPALSRNQQAVANAITGYFDANGSVPAGFAALSPAGLTSVSGEISTAAVGHGLHAAELFLGAITDPFVTDGGAAAAGGDAGAAAYGETTDGKASDAAFDAALGHAAAHSADPVDAVLAKRWRLWGAAYGGAETIGGDPLGAGSHDLSSNLWGIASGVELRTGQTRIGIALGGGGGSFDLDGGLGSGSSGIFNAGLYGSQAFGDAYLSAGIAYGLLSTQTDRTVGADTLSTDFVAHTVAERLELGYRIETPFAVLTPFVAGQATSYFLPGHSETSSGSPLFAISYGSQTETAARTELGLQFEQGFDMGAVPVSLAGRAAWAYNAVNARDVTGTFQALPGQPFTISGAQPNRNAFLVDAGAAFAISPSVHARIGFQGQFSQNLASYAATPG